MEQQNLFQNGTPKLEEPLETTLTREVKGMYLSKGCRLGVLYPHNPFATFNRAWFRECFAIVAHRHGLFYHRSRIACDLTGDEAESRAQYGRYFKVVARRLHRALRRLNKNADVVPPVRREAIRRESHFPADQRDQSGSQNRDTRPPEVTKRLKEVREGLVQLHESRKCA